MKVTKQQLKALIKECLVEILVEGIDNTQAVIVSEAVERSRRQPQAQQPQQRHHGLSPRPALHAAVNEVAAGDRTLQGILADTAATTMPAQSAAEGPMGMSAAQAMSEGVNTAVPVEDGNSQWADMAFSTKRPDPTKILALGFDPTPGA